MLPGVKLLKSTDCIAADFDSRWYKKWQRILDFPPAKHPKFWETAALAEALEQRGCLKPGKSGLGMGVGNEQLVSLFASRGVSVTATDQDAAQQKARKWDNGQLAHNAQSLYYPGLLSKSKFNKLVKFEAYDMNTEHKAYAEQFDFVWHNCVIGHLGSLDNAIRQLERSASYLKPGGWLIFTTELNIASLTDTIADNSDTVIWRLTDLELLSNRLAKIGMVAQPLSLRLGNSHNDNRINYNHGHLPPGKSLAILQDPARSEIKIPFAGFALTQVLLCFQKNEKVPRNLPKDLARATQRNTKVLQRHIKHNSDLAEYYQSVDPIEYQDAPIMPEQKEMTVTIPAGSQARLSLRYLNRSAMSLYDFSIHTPYNRPPLVVATFDPVNRDSVFKAPGWSSPNRPALSFTPVKIRQETDWHGHRAKPAEWFEYSFLVKAPAKRGTYTESFVLVFEGQAVVMSSIVTVIFKVTDKPSKKSAPNAVKSYSPLQMLHKLGWPRTPARDEIAHHFIDWLNELAQRDFRYRLYMRPHETLVFLESFLDAHYPGVQAPSHLAAKTVKHQLDFIKVNEPTLVPSLRTRLILIPSTPRVGGTMFSHMLGELTGWPRYTAAQFNIMDLNGFSGPTIIHMHITHQEFQDLKLDIPYKSIALARDPLDTLVSAFNFAQHNPGVVNWLNLRVFPKPLTFKDKTADSPEFLAWAKSDGAKQLLSVTPSWWEVADVQVKYEELKQRPVGILKQVLAAIDPDRAYSETYIKSVADKIDRGFLVNATNQHRWRGTSGYARQLIPKTAVETIEQIHSGVFDQLGYLRN